MFIWNKLIKNDLIFFLYGLAKMGLDVTKPVFMVSDKVTLKPDSSATETS